MALRTTKAGRPDEETKPRYVEEETLYVREE
jgi:hypothetical protein